MLYLEAEKEFWAHTWPFDSTHEYFESWEYERLTPTELREILILVSFFFPDKKNPTKEMSSIFKEQCSCEFGDF